VTYKGFRYERAQVIAWFAASLAPLVFVVLAGILALEAKAASVDGDLAQTSFSGRPLTQVIEQYIRSGYSIIYSNALVKSSMRVEHDPVDLPPIERLEALLKAHGLTLKPGVKQNWSVVKASVERPPASDTQPEVAAHKEQRLEEVIVTSSRYRLREDEDNSRYLLDTNDLSNFPALVEDVTRAITRVAGTATQGISARPNIRGGSNDELLILYDGVELLDPFHLRDFQSIVSSFNPSVISEIDFYTGGFPAQFGSRLSGVMKVASKPSLTETRAELGLSLFNTSALVSGNFAGGKGEWLATARRGNLDLLASISGKNLGEPSYYDSNLLMSYELNSDASINGGLFAFGDDIRLKDGSDNDGEKAQSDYQNLYGWLNFETTGSRFSFSQTQLSFGIVDHDRDGQILEPDENLGAAEDIREFKILRLKQVLEQQLGNQALLRLGGRISLLQGSYDFRARVQRGDLARIVGTPELLDLNLAREVEGNSGNLFVSYRWKYSPKLIIESGLRWAYQNFSNLGVERYLSPRLNLRYDFSNSWHLKASAGRFFQPQNIHELQVSDGKDQFQKAQYADQVIVGLEVNKEGSLRARLELFYKKVGRPKQRFENLFNNLVLIPEIRADRISVEPDRARVQGLELSFSYHSGERTTAWLNYSLSRAEDHDRQGWRPRIWDQRHTLNSGWLVQLRHWNLSANFAWHSGWRTTLLPEQVSETELPLELRRNDGLLRDYVSLDLRLSRTWRAGNQEFSAYFQLANTLNHVNVGGVDYAIDTDPSGVIRIEPDHFALLPLIPSLGLTWRLH